MSLYHYTCAHTYQTLGFGGEVSPLRFWNYDAAARLPKDFEWMADLVWFTDLTPPIPEALGLTRRLLSCDRTEHRYRVSNGYGILPWVHVARHSGASRAQLEDLHNGAVLPAHWFVARKPVHVVHDPIVRVEPGLVS